ncbi:MAG: serine/threonine protein kinase [Symploca sp. SIO2D2]|nr:serine/threonine protein kinase [Symploca sp. SIO2D2]
MKLLHGQGEVIAERYQIVTLLGEGGMGSTYAAVDLRTHQRVAIKVVSLREARDWKTLELFEREAQVLATLNHSFIPHYLDYFQLDVKEGTANSDYRFYLVQELVEGESLAALVKRGWRTTETEVKDIARQVLEILTYIHQLNPPIIHRDIKPQNIIRRADGKVYLVDFGAVQTVYNQTIGGSKTLVGTFGYMPFEQFQGKVHCASDLYSLGCTLIFLLTHRSPADLPQKRMKIDFRQGLDISNGFATWLERMSEPMLETRFQSATEAIQPLQQPDLALVQHSRNNLQVNFTHLSPSPHQLVSSGQAEEVEELCHLAPVIPKPNRTHIELTQTAKQLTIKIPHYHHKKGYQVFATGLFSNLFSIGYKSLICISLSSIFLSIFKFIPYIFNVRCIIILSILLYLFIQIRRLIILLRCSFELSIKPHIFEIHIKECVNNCHIQGNPRDLEIIDELRPGYDCSSFQYKKQRLKFEPINGCLTETEKRWMYQHIINFIKKWNLF